MAFISDSDFSVPDFLETHTLGQKQAHVDNKADWVKMIMTLVKNYDPIEQSDFAIVIVDIFYAALGLESNYKIMSQQQTSQIIEELLETLFLVSNHIIRLKKLES
jgi:hypothetical protein